MKNKVEISESYMSRPTIDRRVVLVQCSSSRCMAYRDGAGKWRNYFNQDELKGDIKELSC